MVVALLVLGVPAGAAVAPGCADLRLARVTLKPVQTVPGAWTWPTTRARPNTRWEAIFGSFHGNIASLVIELGAEDQTGAVMGPKSYSNQRTSSGTHETELTFVELWHRPQS